MPKERITFLSSRRVVPMRAIAEESSLNLEILKQKREKIKMDKIIEDAVRRSEGRGSTEQDYDTDSVASSVSFTDAIRQRRRAGISPLNRRQSTRIALLKKVITHSQQEAYMVLESTMQVIPSLQSQNTVKMREFPVPLQKMETSSRWTNHRGKPRATLESQETVCLSPPKRSGGQRKVPVAAAANIQLPKGTSKWVKYRNDRDTVQSPEILPSKRPRLKKGETQTETDGNSKSALLKKMSTTWGLRQMMGETRLENPDEASTSATQDVNNCYDEVDANDSPRMKLKRKASTPLSPDKPVKKGILLKKKTRRLSSKKVTVVAPDEEAKSSSSQGSPALKRHLSLNALPHSWSEECLLSRAKRLKVQQSTIQHADVFIPSPNLWPVHITAQVVWDLPLEDDEGNSYEASTVHVNKHRCLIGLKNGIVIELDANVVPSKKYVLQSGVTCLNSIDMLKYYAACKNGTLYNLAAPENPMWESNSGRINKCASYLDKIVVATSEGELTLLNSSGHLSRTIYDKERKDTWMLFMDSNGIYQGNAKGVFRYTLDGKEVWFRSGESNTQKSLGLYGPGCAMGLDDLYVSSGCGVSKLDKFSGKEKKLYNYGAAHTHNVNGVAVGGGLVFAAGKTLVCYDEESTELVYSVKLPNEAEIVAIQYFQARLFCLSSDCLYVLDFTQHSMKTAMEGNTIECTEVSLDALHIKQDQALDRVNSINSEASSTGFTPSVECHEKPKERRGKLKVKAMSIKGKGKR